MNIFKAIWGGIKTILPFLMTAAEKSFKSLPSTEQERLKMASIVTQVVKKGFEAHKPIKDIIADLLATTGYSEQTLFTWFNSYWTAKGHTVADLSEAVSLMIADASMRTKDGLKELWNGFTNLVGGFITNVDWEALTMGLIEYVFRTYVKGKI